MKLTIRGVIAVAIAYCCMGSLQSFAQDNLWTNTGTGGTWQTGSNWNLFAAPDPDFDQRAIVGSSEGSGDPNATANVTSNISATNPSPEIVLGNGNVAGVPNAGTLNITGSGNLSVEFGAVGDGHIDVGLDGGIGILNVAGTLSVEGNLNAPSSGSGDSSITFSGSANVSARDGFFDKNFAIEGSSVSFSVTDDLILGGSGTHTWQIPAGGASTISVGGNVDLGGTLELQFPNGAPAVGTTWNLVDSTTVDAEDVVPTGFDTIDQSTTGVGIGQRFVVDSVAGGTNGVLSQLKLEQHPVLVVNRNTGATEIRNYGSGPSIGIDVYTISSSGSGLLVPGFWSSLSAGDPNGTWVEANPTQFDLTEVNVGVDPNDVLSVAGNSAVSIGSPVSIPSASFFGQNVEDLRFRYATPGESFYTEGTVIYTGASESTLTLYVDPNTGEAAIHNGTGFSPEIDVYRITSATGSLDPNDSAWSSLEDQGTSGGNWFEANPSDEAISELLTIGTLTLDPNDTQSIGSPFDTSGSLDLVFQFAIVEDAAGDFNGDGRVDAQDFLEWQRDPSIGDIADFNANYGNQYCNCSGELLTGAVVYGAIPGPLATVTAVPEPATAGLLVAGVSALVLRRRR